MYVYKLDPVTGTNRVSEEFGSGISRVGIGDTISLWEIGSLIHIASRVMRIIADNIHTKEGGYMYNT